MTKDATPDKISLMKTLLSMLLIFLSIMGIADAGYLTWNKLNNIMPPCAPGSDCGAVLSSPWASIGPVPLAAIGLIFYTTVLILSALKMLDFDLPKYSKKFWNLFRLNSNNTWRFLTIGDLLLILTSLGLIFSMILVSIMAFSIRAWCEYCLVSATISTLLFITNTIFYYRYAGQSPFVTKRIVLGIEHLFYKVFKFFFFLFDPEFIHHTMIKFGKLLGKTRPTRFLVKTSFAFNHPILSTTINDITFPNPVGLSAGYDYDGDLVNILPETGFGWHTIGTVTRHPYGGNPKPRLGRFPKSKALLVNKGLKSIGAEAMIAKLNQQKFRIPTCISIASTNQLFKNEKEQLEDIRQTFQLFEQSKLKHQLYELNISCPNTFGGEPFTSPNRLEILLKVMDRLKLSRPLFVKMPIDLSAGEMIALGKILTKHNVQGLNIGNLAKDRSNPAVHPADRREWKQRKGNLSGKPTWDLSNKHIRLIKKEFKNRFTIIGTGGIFSGQDAQHKLDLGADLVQLITGMIYGGPQTLGEINHYLARGRHSK